MPGKADGGLITELPDPTDPHFAWSSVPGCLPWPECDPARGDKPPLARPRAMPRTAAMRPIAKNGPAPQRPASRYLGTAPTSFLPGSPCSLGAEAAPQKLLAGACCWSGSARGPRQGSKQVPQAGGANCIPVPLITRLAADFADSRRSFRQGQVNRRPSKLSQRPLTGGGRPQAPRPV